MALFTVSCLLLLSVGHVLCLEPTTPTRLPTEYDTILRQPPGCGVGDCDIFIGMETNEGSDAYLDVYMQGTAAGWLAVGFTVTPNMVRIIIA